MEDSLRYIDGANAVISMSTKLGYPTWGDIIATIALIVSVIIFICQMKIERNNRDNNQKKTWFLEVIVKPGLDELHRSYLEFIENIIQITIELKEKDSIISASDLRELQSKRMAELLDSISNRLEPFSMMVKSYDFNLGQKLSIVENELVDIASEIINNYTHILEEDIRTRVLKNYQTYIAGLYSQFSIQSGNSSSNV